jgi:hypothetical protein
LSDRYIEYRQQLRILHPNSIPTITLIRPFVVKYFLHPNAQELKGRLLPPALRIRITSRDKATTILIYRFDKLSAAGLSLLKI